MQSSAEKVDFTGLMPEQVRAFWQEIEPLLKPAMTSGETAQSLFSNIMDRKAQVWIAATPKQIEAACVTEIYTRDARKYCNIWLAGGRGVNNWLHNLSTVEAWAKEQGCDAMVIEAARRGWQRIIKGYKIKTIALTKEL